MHVMFAGLQNLQYRTNGFDLWSDRGRPAVKAESTTMPGMKMTLVRKGADSLTLLLDRKPQGRGKNEKGEFELAADPTATRDVLDHTVSRIGTGWAYDTSISPNVLSPLAGDILELRQQLDASVKADKDLPKTEKLFAKPEFTIENGWRKGEGSDFLYKKAFSEPEEESLLYDKVKDLTQADVLLKIADQMEAGQAFTEESLYRDLLGDTSGAEDYQHLSHNLHTCLLGLEGSRFITRENSAYQTIYTFYNSDGIPRGGVHVPPDLSQVHLVVAESGQTALAVARQFTKALAAI
jgi:hypothetical protein